VPPYLANRDSNFLIKDIFFIRISKSYKKWGTSVDAEILVVVSREALQKKQMKINAVYVG
jgi:hypothetical protein